MRYPLLAVFSMASLVVTGLNNGLSKSDWASWVQAVGSIGAIVGTWAIARHQLLYADRSRAAAGREEEKLLYQIGLRLAKDVYGIHGDVHRKFTMNQSRHPAQPKAIGTERIREMQSSLHNFTLKGIPPALHAEMLVLLRELAFTQTAVREQSNLPHTSNQRIKRAGKRLATVLKSRDRIHDILNTL